MCCGLFLSEDIEDEGRLQKPTHMLRCAEVPRTSCFDEANSVKYRFITLIKWINVSAILKTYILPDCAF